MFQVIKKYVVYIFNILETKILQYRCHCQNKNNYKPRRFCHGHILKILIHEKLSEIKQNC